MIGLMKICCLGGTAAAQCSEHDGSAEAETRILSTSGAGDVSKIELLALCNLDGSVKGFYALSQPATQIAFTSTNFQFSLPLIIS